MGFLSTSQGRAMREQKRSASLLGSRRWRTDGFPSLPFDGDIGPVNSFLNSFCTFVLSAVGAQNKFPDKGSSEWA